MKTIHLKTSLIVLFCFAIFLQSKAERPCDIMYPRGTLENWGIGVYWIPKNTKIKLYQSQSEEDDCGMLVRHYSNLRLEDYSRRTQHYEFSDIDWLGHYDYPLLKVYSMHGKFVKVFRDSFTDGLFIKRADLEQYARLFTYEDLLFEQELPDELKKAKQIGNLGVNLTKTCMNLRTAPMVSSEKIICIPGNNYNWRQKGYTKLAIKKVQKPWIEVEVTNYIYKGDTSEKGDCGEIENKTQGWLKALDDNGFPNIWFSVTIY